MDAQAKAAALAAADFWQKRVDAGESETDALFGLLTDYHFAAGEVGALAFFAGLILSERMREGAK